MWRPPERIRYASGPGRVPTREEAARSRLFSPLRAGAPWLRSQQTPLDVTQPYWQSPTNVHLVAPGVLTFLDRSVPAWFRVTLAGGLPAVMHMTAAAHFMTDRYVGFGEPVEISPPPSR